MAPGKENLPDVQDGYFKALWACDRKEVEEEGRKNIIIRASWRNLDESIGLRSLLTSQASWFALNTPRLWFSYLLYIQSCIAKILIHSDKKKNSILNSHLKTTLNIYSLITRTGSNKITLFFTTIGRTIKLSICLFCNYTSLKITNLW